mmetsp:Transcript_18280/g.51651  ORF Transcript_18280/g.51651 Transcript_18280/m.51651 type:complete len:201 (-) Transcript_18280:367-969(-)
MHCIVRDSSPRPHGCGADAPPRALVPEHCVPGVPLGDLCGGLPPPLRQLCAGDVADDPGVVGGGDDLAGRCRELPILEEEDEVVVRLRAQDRGRPQRHHGERDAEYPLNAVAEDHIPDAHQGFALQRRREEAHEPLRAHEEQVEAVPAQRRVHKRQALLDEVLEYRRVRAELLHPVRVPATGPQFHEQLPHRQVRGAFVA